MIVELRRLFEHARDYIAFVRSAAVATTVLGGRA